MKVKILDGGLLIEPETDFEKDFLKINFSLGQNIKAYLNYGPTTSELAGLKIYVSKIAPTVTQIREGNIKQSGVAIKPPGPKPDVRPVAQKQHESQKPHHKKPERRRLVDILENKPNKPILMNLKGVPE